MIFLLSSLLFLFHGDRKFTVEKYLFLLLFFSSISAFLVGRQHSWNPDTLIYVLYVDVLLCFLFNGFRGFRIPRTKDFSNLNKDRLKTVETIISVISIVVLLIDIFILYRMMGLLLLQQVEVQEFKNEGGAIDMFSHLVPSYLLSFSNMFNCVGYFSLSLHFYYLVNYNRTKALKYFLFSLTIVVAGLISLSRYTTIQFVLTYIGLLVYIYPMLGSRIKKSLFKILIFLGVVVFSALYVISTSRFSDFYTKKSQNAALISEEDNPVLFSSLDYFSQWEENSTKILKIHKTDDIFYGFYSSFGVGSYIAKKVMGQDAYAHLVDEKIEKRMGYLSMGFHGPIARLVFDFGFVGTILYILFFNIVVRKCSKRGNVVDFKKMCALPVLLPFPSLFFVGNVFASMNIDVAIFINYVLCKYVIQDHAKITSN